MSDWETGEHQVAEVVGDKRVGKQVETGRERMNDRNPEADVD